MNCSFWNGKRVFITGHTGFKGGWLSLWLGSLGAEVHGFALDPPTTPSLFEEAGIGNGLAGHVIGDVRDAAALAQAIDRAQPDIVFHMAAQPLVRHSYVAPVETYAVNVMGTVNLLEAARQLEGIGALVNVTTDKCYENREWQWGYRENEPLGGRDPYSSSKACSELITAAYRSSFQRSGGPGIASARAGNVIGGGDWAQDRILPDILRAIDAEQVLIVRQPGAIRPWQHVLEPLAGYLLLAEQLVAGGERFARAWNFGPDDSDAQPVGRILEIAQSHWPALQWRADREGGVHEANYLKLDSSSARAELGWRPRWPLATAIAKTMEWHRAWRGGSDMRSVCLGQIDEYQSRVGHG